MENRISRPWATPEIANSAVSSGLKSVGLILAGSLLVALCSHIRLPLWFTPVPLTMQPFAVLLLGLTLSPRLAGATLVAYLLEGIAGLPVFTPGFALGTGLGHMLGPTGGYLMSYPAAAAWVALLRRRMTPRLGGKVGKVISAAAGSALILLCGFVWLVAWTHVPLRTGLALSVVPFLPGDALKVLAAAAIAEGLDRLRLRH